MRHARAEDLAPVEPLLTGLRTIEALTERKPGTFYRKSTAFVHFHVDPAGIFADVKVDGAFQRFRVSTPSEQRRVLGVVRRTLRGT